MLVVLILNPDTFRRKFPSSLAAKSKIDLLLFLFYPDLCMFVCCVSKISNEPLTDFDKTLRKQ